MASKNGQKDDTAPPLLLMPAGKGLTMNTSLDCFSSNVMLPVAQPELPVMNSEVDAEVDSFVGQSPPRNASASNLFSQESDCPFSTISQPRPGSQTGSQTSLSSQTGSQTGSLFGDMFSRSKSESPARSTPDKPLYQKAPATGVGLSLFGKSTATGPQVGASGAPAPTGQIGPPRFTGIPTGPSRDYHRPSGAPRYAPPTHLYTPTYQTSSPVAGAFTNSMSASSPYSSSVSSVPVAEVAPMPHQPGASVNLSMSGWSGRAGSSDEHQYSDGAGYSSQYSTSPGYQTDQTSQQVYTPGSMYSPVQPHWFYCKLDLSAEWRPMSLLDSMRLEEEYLQYCHTGETSLVATDGGRYDVDLTSLSRRAVYWEEAPTEVRRCTWFYKNEGDNKFIPYELDFAARLEEEYRTALLENVWHKRLEFPGGEMIVIHNPNVIVHFRPSSLPDEWGTTQGEQLRPRVVKRGVEEFEGISDGEKDQIDHLVLVVHGIGEYCDIKFRSLVQCVDDMRCNADQLMENHFKSDMESGRVGRVEFLPVHWHQALHGDNTGIDRNLKRITLKSIPKLRSYTNETLLDILFYTSPKYCQTIVDKVCDEMNRLYHLFLARNPQFKGEVSTAGHSLGSTVLFDLLCHQGEQRPDDNQSESESVHEEEKVELSLETVLAQLELTEFSEKLQAVDVQKLLTASEEEMKELGLPAEPRKKIINYIQNHKEKRSRDGVSADRTALVEADKNRRSSCLNTGHHLATVKDPLYRNASRSSVNYLCGVAGTGQPFVVYPRLDFSPVNFFALGSPIALFLSTRGITRIGDDFRLPQGTGVFNIFHPFDPVAYRIEPLIVETFSEIKPVLIPHHKGRKRLHLELRESLSKVGADIKQKIMDSLRSTWNSINEFARAHVTDSIEQQEDVDDVLKQIASATDDNMSATESVCNDEDISIGSLNGGRRVDYVLQEKPIESFNDYLFALASHGCYWESEDTCLLILKETYALLGVHPQKKGPSGVPVYDARAPPPTAGFQRQNPLTSAKSTPPAVSTTAPPPPVPLHTVDQSQNSYQPYAPPGFSAYQSQQMEPHSQSYAPPTQFTHQYGATPSNIYVPPQPNNEVGTAPPRPVGPPPMGGFVRKV